MEVVFVKTITGKTIAIEAELSDSVGEVKRKIKERTDMLSVPPNHDQCLTYAGKQLEDHHTLAHYHIEKESTLHLHFLLRPDEPVHVFFKRLVGGTATLAFRPSDTIAQMKQTVEDKLGIPADQQLLAFGKLLVEDQHTLADYNIENESTVYIIVRRG